MPRTSGASRPTRYLPPAAIAFLVSFLLGLLWMLYAKPEPFSDFIHYYRLAEGLIDHQQFGYPRATAGRLPGYPAFLAIPMLASRSVAWLALCNVVMTALVAVMVYYIALRVTSGNRPAAAIAAFLCAVNPTFVLYSPVLASEHLFAPLLFASLLVVLVRPFGAFVNAVVAGLLAGATILTRGEAVFYVPILLLVLVRAETERRRRVIVALSLLLACFVVVFPWYLRNLALFGPGVGLTTKTGVNLYIGHNPKEYGKLPEDFFEGRSAMAAERDAREQAVQYLTENPLRLLRDVANGTKELYLYDAFYALRGSMVEREREGNKTYYIRRTLPPGARGLLWAANLLLLLGAIAGAVFCRRYMPGAWVLLGLLLMNWVAHAVVFFGKSRFRYSMEAVFCVFAGVALYRGYTALLARRRAKRASPPAGAQ